MLKDTIICPEEMIGELMPGRVSHSYAFCGSEKPLIGKLSGICSMK